MSHISFLENKRCVYGVVRHAGVVQQADFEPGTHIASGGIVTTSARSAPCIHANKVYSGSVGM